jgi:hypothetical protein
MDLEYMFDNIRKDIEKEAKEKIKNMYMERLNELFDEMFSDKQYNTEKKIEVKEMEATNTDPYACSNCKSYKHCDHEDRSMRWMNKRDGRGDCFI